MSYKFSTQTERTNQSLHDELIAKAEAMIPIEEFKNDKELEKLKVGSIIDVYLERIENFKGEIYRLDENDILNNYEEFISSLINKSLFEDCRLIIISRASEKIIKLVNEILDRDIEKIKVIISCDNLEKK